MSAAYLRSSHLLIALLSFLLFFTSAGAFLPPDDGAVILSDLPDTPATKLLLSRPWQELAENKDFLKAILPEVTPPARSDSSLAAKGRVIQLTRTGTEGFALELTGHRVQGIIIIFKTDEKLRFQNFGRSTMQDIDHDGVPEVIVWNEVVSTIMLERLNLPTIWRFNDREFVESNAKFKKFFQSYLQQMDILYTNVSATNIGEKVQRDNRSIDEVSEWKRLRLSDIAVCRFYARQVLGEKEAGLEEAVKWSQDASPQIRKNALTLFSLIGNEECRKHVEALAKDPSPLVSNGAKRILHFAAKKNAEKTNADDRITTAGTY